MYDNFHQKHFYILSAVAMQQQRPDRYAGRMICMRQADDEIKDPLPKAIKDQVKMEPPDDWMGCKCPSQSLEKLGHQRNQPSTTNFIICNG